MKSDEVEKFLREPRIADLATVRPDGSPHVAPVWFHYDGENVKIIADPEAVKLRNIDHDPRVALSIATPDAPYRYVIVRGTAERSDEDPWELVRVMALNYKGEVEGPDYAARIKSKLTLCTIIVTPSRIIGWTDDT